MAMTTEATTVRKSVTVNTGVEHAFDVFTAGFDTWWPRTHHIGKKPMQKAVIEPRAGGRCYSREIDGNECQWGTVTAWEPPRRLVLAWQIDPAWQFDPDMTHASEVEVRFTAEGNGMTRVDLEHRHLERHGKDFDKIRIGVAGPGGWSGLLQTFSYRANEYHPTVRSAAFILASSDGAADRAFRDIKPDDLWKQPTPHTNSILWIYAHMVTVRGRLLNALGDSYDPGWGTVFSRGASLQNPETYLSRERIFEVSREVNARLFAKLTKLTDADTSKAAAGAPLPPSVQTLGDQISFIALHDSYHVGQLSYARKALGLPGLAG